MRNNAETTGFRADYHMHTTYCDGAHTPRQMVESGISKGMDAIGLSGHSYVPFDEEWCMSLAGTKDYLREIRSLQEEYRAVIRICAGLEQDYYSEIDTSDFDYIIGSVHYIRKDDAYLIVDMGKETVLRDVQTHFGGDVYAYLEAYYRLVGDVAHKTKCRIVGHFDLVTKFNQNGDLFDERHPRYVKAYREAVQKLLSSDVLFEINMGAIIRQYRDVPYPALPVMDYIHERGGSFVLTSDSHQKETLMYQFDKWGTFFRERGYRIAEDIFALGGCAEGR